MTNEERFERYAYVVEIVIIKLFGSKKTARSIAKNNGADYEDYLQIGYATLWRMVLKHDQESKAFFYFASKAIRFDLMTYLRRKSSLLKLADHEAVAVKKELTFNDIVHFEEVLPHYQNVENYVISKVELESRMKRLNDLDRWIVQLSMQGYKDKEIGELVNRDSAYILCRRNRAYKKMKVG